MNKFILRLKTLLLAAFAFCLWSSIYPEFVYTDNTCKVYDESGRQLELSDVEIYQGLIKASPKKIECKSRLLEYIKALIKDGEKLDLFQDSIK